MDGKGNTIYPFHKEFVVKIGRAIVLKKVQNSMASFFFVMFL